ncbi:hypothetical protein VU01_10744 [Candidatus Electrothrix marina]|uniref:Uncharacterized protein n=1 Tax=Candidatus Electrothrix marina TaxID=1859130 RepID=A0A444JFW0_9BACT|nr:hypothetical protein VU01_10744 [Candidatus Electrothrix marina]
MALPGQEGLFRVGHHGPMVIVRRTVGGKEYGSVAVLYALVKTLVAEEG